MCIFENNRYIREINLKTENIPDFDNYPFSLPAVKNLDSLKLDSDVTYIIGENGAGKSTILEAVAISYGINPEGGTKNFNFKTRETHSSLHDYLKLVKGIKKPKMEYFLRAETFYNTATYIDEIQATSSYGGKSLHSQSHGEAFLSLFLNKFTGNSLYILDEPEAALSPSCKLAVLKRIDDLVKEDSQFIIATHSPIIMAYPKSKIFLLTEKGYEKINYKETEHYLLSRDFLKDPDLYIKHLFS